MKTAIAGAAALCLFAGCLSKGRGLEAALPERAPAAAFGPEARASIAEFAKQRGLDPERLRRRYAASGTVHCGRAHGAGQLTLADDVVTTAAHVLYDRQGRLRGDSGHCAFVVEANGVETATALEVEGVIAGSTDPYSQSPVHDWAVVKLAQPLRDAEPYRLAEWRPRPQAPVLFVARGALDWVGGRDTSLQPCRLREALEDGVEGTREFAFDCAAGIGASGAGLLDGENDALLAIFVGLRSAAAPFAPTHSSFAVTVEGAFRRAIERQAALGATAQAR